ncbi:YeeE/YedE family protein [Aquamicrobium sp. NLF2-7]|uniref:YeeE/YedE family protein n=1 Tax=Aquamicrobium sp. NLF2-7 TaxID=2918753 RepID=UPI001EFBC5F2|nr:YeeE/YedE family protein [Aquamicrobium sp. NLF2-7]MCG8272612.1 YeeE/YedE family protein [Aquamicrobium sp. NLF2-7]
MNIATHPWFLAFAGLGAGILLGFVARANHFCTMSALERMWYADDSRGVRTWMLAAATAMIVTQSLQALGMVDTQSSFYIHSSFAWVGAIAGGLAFGIGMALVGTCSFGALVRLGGGSLRSLIVLIVLGLAAMSAQKGLVAQARVALSDNHAIDLSEMGGQSIGALASWWSGHDLTLTIALVAGLAMLCWIFNERRYRSHTGSILTGLTIGLIITFGWWATTYASEHSFEVVQIEAGSFVVPVADTILHAITFTGVVPDYGVGLVLGVIGGAAACAAWKRDVRWEACDDARELGRHIAGGALMGFGGVFAMGCTIGQGVTGVSALAISAPLVLASIFLGAKLGLAYLIEGSPLGAFRAMDRQPAE